MYSVGTYSNNISLGERGVIIDEYLDTAEGSFILNAIECVNAAKTSDPYTAWTVSSGVLDQDNFVFSEINSQSWAWRVTDPGTGVVTMVTCIEKEIQGQPGNPRLDITNIVDPQVGREDPGDGYCVTGVIDTMQATPLNVQLNAMCEDKSDARYAQILVDVAANDIDAGISVRKWCDLAIALESNKPGCFQNIFGTGMINTQAWNEALCEVNNAGSSAAQTAISECINSIESMGLENYVNIHGPGYLQEFQSENDGRCGLSERDYGLQTEEDSCQMGVYVEYESFPNVWEQEFFIPSDFPPCDGKLIIDPVSHPNLFLYPIRLRQCELSDQCTIENSCQSIAGFEGSLQFSGCPA